MPYKFDNQLQQSKQEGSHCPLCLLKKISLDYVFQHLIPLPGRFILVIQAYHTVFFMTTNIWNTEEQEDRVLFPFFYPSSVLMIVLTVYFLPQKNLNILQHE